MQPIRPDHKRAFPGKTSRGVDALARPDRDPGSTAAFGQHVDQIVAMEKAVRRTRKLTQIEPGHRASGQGITRLNRIRPDASARGNLCQAKPVQNPCAIGGYLQACPNLG
jgi:hypothetical protein